jgi:RNA polymerase sigma-70 factor (ECF subfamily)
MRRPTNAPYRDTVDEELVLLAQAGNTAAFGVLVERHSAICFKRAVSILRNQDDAEDEVQNALSKAFECLTQFRFQGSFVAWLCKIVQTRCLMTMRSRRREALFPVDGILGTHRMLEFVCQKPSQEDELGSQQLLKLIHSEMSHIPMSMRSAIVLRDVLGLPIPEIAKRLGISVPAAKSRLTRARKEMRWRLTKAAPIEVAHGHRHPQPFASGECDT